MAKYRLLISPVGFQNLQDAFMRDITVMDVWPGSTGPNPMLILERFFTGVASFLQEGDEVALEVQWTWVLSRAWQLTDYTTGAVIAGHF